MKKAEKICRMHTGPRKRKEAKRRLRRARRRDERQRIEDAGTKNCHYTRGWTD